MSRTILSQLEQVNVKIKKPNTNPNYTYDVDDILNIEKLIMSPYSDSNAMSHVKKDGITDHATDDEYEDNKNEDPLIKLLNRTVNRQDDKRGVLDVINSVTAGNFKKL